MMSNSRYHQIIRRQSRDRQVRRQFHPLRLIVSGLAAVLAVLIIGLIAHGIHTQAAAEEQGHIYKYKYYQSVVLQREDNLQELAVQYADPAYYKNTRVYLKEVADINHLSFSEGRIEDCHAGMRLILPYYDERVLR